MTLVGELDLPEFDLSAPEYGDETYHRRLGALRARSWLARSPIAVLVLDRDAGEFFLRSRATAFPGRQIAELFGITSGPLFDHIDANILNLSDERHRRLRSIVSRAFTPVAADRWRPVMRQILEERWGHLADDGRIEVVATLAKPYPSLTIAAVLGAPAADAPRLHEWSSWVQRQFDIRALSTDLPKIEAAVLEVNDYVEDLLAKPREDEDGSLLAALVAAEADGDRLSHAECVNLAVNVLAGAIDTTQSQLSHALHLFATHPDQWARLGASPDLVGAAVTEVLRVEPVVPFTARVCLDDVDCQGVVFPKGTIVAICAERANRELEGGEDFDITAKRDGRLLTFGAGQHFCLGAHLARAELEEALGFLAPRMPGMEPDGAASFGGIEGIYGVEVLRLRWSASSRFEARSEPSAP
jgi:cytochrome P450